MKKLLILFLISCNAAFSQTKDYKVEASDIYNDIRNLDFYKVTAKFDSSLSRRIDSTRIRKLWEEVLRVAGPFINVIDTVQEHQADNETVIQQTLFEKRKIDFKLLFGTNGKIIGLSFVPTGLRDKYKLPPYYSADLIKEKDLILQDGPYRLAGSLTTPKKPGRFPVVIMVHGTGRSDKDETVGSIKMFKDIAYGLAAQGIGVYRFDKRSRMYFAQMSKEKNQTVNSEIIDDVVSAIKTLKADSTVDSTAIYLCGHSLGGMVLPRAAERLKEVKGLIYLAPNARRLEDMIVDYTNYIISLDTTGKDHKSIIDSVKTEAAKIKNLSKADTSSKNIFQLPRSYWVDLNGYNPFLKAQSLKTPMLFLQGGRDYQVSVADFTQWKNKMKGHNAEFKLYDDLNHFFVTGQGKSIPSEYNKSGNVDVKVINDISSWILRIEKK